MSSLLDLAPMVRVVSLRGKDIRFHGITAEGLVVLFTRFPELKKAIQAEGTITAETLTKFGPPLLAAAIAYASEIDGESEMEESALRKQRGKLEKAAAGLNIGEMLDVVRAVIEITFPGGVGPFVQELMAMGLVQEKVASPNSSNGASVATGRAQDTKLESPSPTP